MYNVENAQCRKCTMYKMYNVENEKWIWLRAVILNVF